MNKQTKPGKRQLAAQEEPRVYVYDLNTGIGYDQHGKSLKVDRVTGRVKMKPRYERVRGLLVMGRKPKPRAARKSAPLCRVVEFPKR